MLTVRLVWPAAGGMEYHVLDGRRSLLATARYVPEDQVAALLRSYGLRQWTAAALQVVDAPGSKAAGQERPLSLLTRPGPRRPRPPRSGRTSQRHSLFKEVGTSVGPGEGGDNVVLNWELWARTARLTVWLASCKPRSVCYK